MSAQITDGNLNFAFSVGEASGAPVLFVKQAPAYIKCLGESHPLAATRAHLESAALVEFSRLAPEFTPQHYLLDAERCIVITEFLQDHVLLRTALCADGSPASRAGRAAADVGTFMGAVHSARPGFTESGRLRVDLRRPAPSHLAASSR